MATQQLFISRQQYDALKNKQLIKNLKHSKDLNPRRVDKFMERGWRFAK
jgi:hypothetical protein